jgi:DNA modification methylase
MSDLQPHWQNDRVTLYCGDALETLKQLPAESVHCCVTSPPYYGLRDYGVEGQIGLEQTPDEYIAKMVEVFREVRRVLRSDGTCWINIGDSYFSQTKGSGGSNPETSPKNAIKGVDNFQRFDPVRIESGSTGCKPKDLIGIPWMLAFALRADGWYLRQDIIWNKPNPMPESVRDRCTKSHEYIFLLSKSSRYYFDNKAIAEKSLHPNAIAAWTCDSRASRGHMLRGNPVGNEASGAEYLGSETRNRRSVWQVTTKPYKGAHFAVFPADLIEPCILAGTSASGCCMKCLSPFVPIVEKPEIPHDGETMTAYESKSTAGRLALLRQAARERGGEYANTSRIVGWRPSCKCDGVDRRIVGSPLGSVAESDPSILTGRAGYNRKRGKDGGQRVITRHEQAMYAEQLRSSPFRDEMMKECNGAFAHYIRTDDSGARPLPDSTLREWLERGWLAEVVVPSTSMEDGQPCVVLDPFAGSGTTGMVASALGRNSILIELNPQYCELIKERVTTGWQKAKPKPMSVKKKPAQPESQSSLFDVLAS